MIWPLTLALVLAANPARAHVGGARAPAPAARGAPRSATAARPEPLPELPFGVGASSARRAQPVPQPGIPRGGAARAHRLPGAGADRGRLLAAARARLGERLAGDCSGFVLGALHAARVAVPPLPPGVSRSESLWRASRPVERPRPGDLAFFHDTYDRNRDGRLGDRFTHVALVEQVDGDRIVLIHRVAARVERLHMNLARPDDETVNDELRLERRGDAPGTRYLAGELFAAFGALLGDVGTQKLQAGHGAVDPVAHPASR